MMRTIHVATLCIFLLLAPSLTHAQECGVIYVTPTGASSGVAGTKANPANLIYGLSLVTPTDNRVWVATGTYNISNALVIPSNAIIDGGFDANTWIKSNNPKSIIQRDASNVLPLPANALIGLNGANASNFSLHDLTIIIADAPAPQVSVYGIYLSGCSDYRIIRCEVITGDAGDGIDGQPGVTGTAGGIGANGLPGNGNEAPEPGGAGGAGGSGANNGGNGAPGGKWNSGNNTNGVAGQPGGCGGNGGATSGGGDCSCGNPFDGCPGNCGGPGSSGGSGQSGALGSSGAAGSAGGVVTGFFQAGGFGGNGTAGTDGCGGGGGGGGGGRQDCNLDAVGGSGGGGGGGSSGGTGGTGGSGGGSAFAIFLLNNGANGEVVDCNLQSGGAGAGGAGGGGGVGSTGGAGGTGVGGGPCGGAVGGTGGAGGVGGVGGNGGNGANGLSVALSQNGGTPATATNNNGVPGNPPAISVENPGCTNSEILFSSASSGSWDFGAGATPATSSGAGSISVLYNSTGRKDIVFSGTTFTEFVDIFRNQSSSTNTIANVNNPAVSGCPDTFSTTLVGTLYEWDFGATALPPTVAGANFQSAGVAFTTPGNYTIVVWVTTQCCGRVRDTLNITIQPNSLNITLAPSVNTICAGDDITYTATPAGYQSYDFYVNTTLAQSSASNTFIATNLAQGDSVRVIAFDGVCFTNPSSVHFPVVNPVPLVTLASSVADTICNGEPVTFTASPAGYLNYEFFDNGTSVHSSASEVYTTSSLAQGNSITVVATEAGCSSALSNAISIVVNPTPTITISVQSTGVCIGDNVTVTASPIGLTNYDFSVNGVSVQNSASETYSAVFNDGDVILVNGTLNGCVLQPSNSITMTVTPIPSVLLTRDAGPAICEGEEVTFTASPAGYDLYEFYDGTTVLQSSASNTFVTTALVNGNDITVIALENNCSSPASNSIATDVNPSAVANFTVDPLESDDLSTVFSFTNNSTNADAYQWSFGDGATATVTSPTHVYPDTGSYTVTLIATNQFNCNDTLERPNYITISQKPIIYVPNVFTPNGDGVNDVLHVQGSAIKRYKLHVFNRWGEMIFASENITDSWDGTYHGKELQPAVFAYDLFVEFTNRTIHRQQGSVTLLK
ncbi:MAG: gliding motility-associated C-terminal domain-containing protein [Chitinophagales bacterium]|nr:gliding motility-associated C-terminal domain-containing protein [Chitinophagales bacterium]